jgi:hypothetical protein
MQQQRDVGPGSGTTHGSDPPHLQVWHRSIHSTVHVGRQEPRNIIHGSKYQAQHGINVWL